MFVYTKSFILNGYARMVIYNMITLPINKVTITLRFVTVFRINFLSIFYIIDIRQVCKSSDSFNSSNVYQVFIDQVLISTWPIIIWKLVPKVGLFLEVKNVIKTWPNSWKSDNGEPIRGMAWYLRVSAVFR